jgi:hypothetical protein
MADAKAMTRRLALEEGLLAGASSLVDSGLRYLNTDVCRT